MKPTTVKDLLAKKIPKSKVSYVPRGFDLVGNIAIVEIKNEVKKYEKEIAKAIMTIHKNIRVVAKKESAMSGKYRTRKLKIIAGEKGRTQDTGLETIYKEHDCLMKLDVAKTYFSIRLSNERLRIAEMVKPKENVFVFFAGVGPFALVIAKKQRTAKVVGIELNPVAVRYFEENIRLNKLKNCKAIRGDVRKVIPRLIAHGSLPKADRILMPLPHTADKFLDSAFIVAKNKCVVHIYSFADSENPFKEAIEKIVASAKKNKCKARILNEKIVRPYAPKIVQVCVDFEVKKN